MVLELLTIDMAIPGSQSLKQKRQHLQSIFAKLSRYNVSSAEIDFQDTWQRSKIAIARVSSVKSCSDNLFASVSQIIESRGEVEIISWQSEHF